MTDKQIIIDGVNVAECKDFFENECFNGEKFRWCKDNKDCYYKQLKRKEQECEELKAEIFHLRNEGNKTCAYCVDFIEKEKQLDQLKAEIINRNEKIEELRFSVSDLTNRLCNLNAEKSLRIVDLEQALQEIKDYCNNYPQNSIGFKQQILQKCEVIDE